MPISLTTDGAETRGRERDAKQLELEAQDKATRHSATDGSEPLFVAGTTFDVGLLQGNSKRRAGHRRKVRDEPEEASSSSSSAVRPAKAKKSSTLESRLGLVTVSRRSSGRRLQARTVSKVFHWDKTPKTM
jgi:hypothetical protein